MTDRETVELLIARDNATTARFFYVSCRPLLTSVMRRVFNYPVDYDEMVSELYAYLMADDAAKLRLFQFRSSLYQWLKVVAIRFFISHRDNMIENTSSDPLYDYGEVNSNSCSSDTCRSDSDTAIRIDVQTMLGMMENRRYADVIRNLVIDDMDPARYAESIGVTVENLYNIKRRAMSALARIAIKYYSND